MKTETKLGKIRSVKIGSGGYQDACFGISFDLGGENWGVGDFWGTWETYSDGAKYTKENWEENHRKAYFKLIKIMHEAKVKHLNALENAPVEIIFDDGALKSWRILTEVL